VKLFGDQTIQKRVLAGKSFLPHCGLSYQLITNEVEALGGIRRQYTPFVKSVNFGFWGM
jgi:hypothetical protein